MCKNRNNFLVKKRGEKLNSKHVKICQKVNEERFLEYSYYSWICIDKSKKERYGLVALLSLKCASTVEAGSCFHFRCSFLQKQLQSSVKFATENTDDVQSSKNIIITFTLSCHNMSNNTVSELTVFEDSEGHKHVPVSIFLFLIIT